MTALHTWFFTGKTKHLQEPLFVTYNRLTITLHSSSPGDIGVVRANFLVPNTIPSYYYEVINGEMMICFISFLLEFRGG